MRGASASVERPAAHQVDRRTPAATYPCQVDVRVGFRLRARWRPRRLRGEHRERENGIRAYRMPRSLTIPTELGARSSRTRPAGGLDVLAADQ